MKRFKMLFVFVIALCSLVPAFLYAQVDTTWVRRYNGSGNAEDKANVIKVDSSGNVYITGQSYGAGSYHDYATIKYNSAGIQQWVQRYNGPGNNNDYAYSLVVDRQGNVYVTGSSRSTSSSGSEDYATIKYNSAGDTLWVKRYNGPGSSTDQANMIAVDSLGNVYVTGTSVGSGTNMDYATIKYNSSGDTVWIRRYNGGLGSSTEVAVALVVDGQGNVYVTGYSSASNYYYDYVTIKYNSAGVQQWLQRYNGPGNDADVAYALAVDGQGNVYVSGYNTNTNLDYDYATIKYNSLGVQQWVQRYNGPGNASDIATTIILDRQANVYVTGRSNGSTSSYDYTTIKYNSSGDTVWVRRYNGSGNTDDYGNAIAVDTLGNVYVTGQSNSSGSLQDYATIKYNSAGVQQWLQRYNGPGNSNDNAYSLAIDGQGDVYVTGSSAGSGTGMDYATIKYTQNIQGVEETKSQLQNIRMIELFPNPAKTFFTVRSSLFALNSALKLYDVNGNIVKSEELKGKNNRISLDGIKNGVYFVKVGNEMIREKLVIAK